MREFVIYTVLRLVIFLGVFVVVWWLWRALGFGGSLFWPLLVSVLLSGVVSIFALNGPREDFARRVDERARKAADKFEEMRAKEDED